VRVDGTRALLFISLVGLLLRLHLVDDEGFWFDEFCTWRQAQLGLPDLLSDLVESDVHPPLYQLLILTWTELAGDDPWALRLPSVLWGACVPLVTAMAARTLFGLPTALLAAAAVALNKFTVYYSQEARSYSLLLLLSTATVAAWWHAYLNPSQRAGLTRRDWLYIAVASLTLYTHIFGALLIAYIALAELWLARRARSRPHAWRRWITTHLTIAAAFAPWLPALWRQAQRVQDDFWIPTPTPGTVLTFFRHYTGHTALAFATVILGVVAFHRAGSARTSAADSRWTEPSERVRLAWLLGLVIWLLGVPYALSVLSQPILHAKSAIASVPALLIVAARGLTHLPRTVQAAVAVTWSAVSLYVIDAHVYRTQNRENWREMAQVVNAELDRRRDLVVLYHPRDDYGFCYRYYLREDADPVDLICESNDCLAPVTALHERSAREGRHRLWLMRMRAERELPRGLDRFWETVETRSFRSGSLLRLELRERGAAPLASQP
jgi:mannosyltransferase